MATNMLCSLSHARVTFALTCAHIPNIYQTLRAQPPLLPARIYQTASGAAPDTQQSRGTRLARPIPRGGRAEREARGTIAVFDETVVEAGGVGRRG